MKKILSMNRFYGGTSSDLKEGLRYSFGYGKHLDFRKKPSQFSLLPATAKDSSTQFTGVPQNMVKVPNGDYYILDSTGKITKRTDTGTYSTIGQVSSGAYGLIYRQDVDTIYAATPTEVGTIEKVTGTAVFTASKITASKSTDSGAYLTGGTNTYTLGTAVSEDTANKQEFTPDIEPCISIKVNINTIGTGNWTMELHDDANNVLATKTITNASLVLGLNEFKFTTPVRMLVKPNARTYHFHLYSSVADGKVWSSSTGSLNTADFEFIANRLISPNNGMHPAALFQQFVCYGNERYLAVHEPLSVDNPLNAEFNRHRLTFPPGYEVCGVAVYDEFLAIACEKRSTSSTSEFQDGKIFFWDGTATTYNYFIDVPEGSPYALSSYKNTLYYIAGGSLFAYAGARPVKIRTMPNTDSEFSSATDVTRIYPYMFTVRRGILLIGYPSTTTNTSIESGVYSLGSIEKNYPDSFGYSYTISSGNINYSASNNLTISMVKNFGDTLFIGWRDDSASGAYGLDVVNNSSAPYTDGRIESLIFDNGSVYKTKFANAVNVTFKALPTGATVRPEYKIDNEASWQYDSTAVAGDTTIKLPINKDFREIQFALTIVATTTTPQITSISLSFDDRQEQQDEF